MRCKYSERRVWFNKNWIDIKIIISAQIFSIFYSIFRIFESLNHIFCCFWPWGVFVLRVSIEVPVHFSDSQAWFTQRTSWYNKPKHNLLDHRINITHHIDLQAQISSQRRNSFSNAYEENNTKKTYQPHSYIFHTKNKTGKFRGAVYTHARFKNTFFSTSFENCMRKIYSQSD